MTEAKTRRIRRSPEVLMKELDAKMQKLENRIYKKNKDFVHQIGVAILKRADFDFSQFSPQDIEDIENMNKKGVRFVNDIIEKAHQNL